MHVLVGIDGTPQRHDAVALGCALVRALGGDLHLAHVLPNASNARIYGADLAGALHEAGQEILDSARDGAADGIVVHEHLVHDDSPARALHDLAQANDIGVLVLGSSHRSRVGRALLGGTAERVAQGSPCAVAVAPKGYEAPPSIHRVGIASDGGVEAREALRWAGDTAVALGGALTVLTVAEPLNVGLYPSAEVMLREDMEASLVASRQRVLDEAVAEAPAQARARGEMLHGAPAKALAGAGQDLDLLVLGSRGYGPQRAVLLGGVSHALLRDAPCPVVVLPRGAATSG